MAQCEHERPSWACGTELRGMTLVEVLVVVGVIILVVGIAVPFYTRARSQSRMVQCVSNIRGQARALGIYLDLQEGRLPPMGAQLPDLLSGQIRDPQTFLCPEDKTGSTDSYTKYYAARKRYESQDSYLLGCGRHEGFRRAVCLLLDFTVHWSYGVRAEWRRSGNSRTLRPGEQISSGNVSLAEGTGLELDGGALRVNYLQSFLRKKAAYHVFQVPHDAFGKVMVSAAPGSRLDVLTPSANFRASGGAYSVETGLTIQEQTTRNYSLVRVTQGEVEVTPLTKGPIGTVAAGKRRTIIGPAVAE